MCVCVLVFCTGFRLVFSFLLMMRWLSLWFWGQWQ